jgi:hypothetical protein
MDMVIMQKQELEDLVSGILNKVIPGIIKSELKAMEHRQPDEEYLTREETKQFIGCSFGSLRNYELSGKLHPDRLGRKVRFRKSEIISAFHGSNPS